MATPRDHCENREIWYGAYTSNRSTSSTASLTQVAEDVEPEVTVSDAADVV